MAESRATLGTSRSGRFPHLVPITFAVVDQAIVTMIDNKPKTTTRLQRLVNIEADPQVTILVDHYSNDWSKLWWVRFDCAASISSEGPEWQSAQRALVNRYGQYRESPPLGPAIIAIPESFVWWRGNQ